jgi:hypothetical protein
MSTLSDALRVIELEGEMQGMRSLVKELRDYLAGALCAACGEPLGHEEEIIQADDCTIHKHCEEYHVQHLKD